MKKLTRRMFIKVSAVFATVGGAAGLGGALGSGCGDVKVDDCPDGTTRQEIPPGTYGYGVYWGYGAGEAYFCK